MRCATCTHQFNSIPHPPRRPLLPLSLTLYSSPHTDSSIDLTALRTVLSQCKNCTAQQFPSRHLSTQAHADAYTVCVVLWGGGGDEGQWGSDRPGGLSLAGAMSPLVTWELLQWISVRLAGYKQGTALDFHTPGNSARQCYWSGHTHFHPPWTITTIL